MAGHKMDTLESLSINYWLNKIKTKRLVDELIGREGVQVIVFEPYEPITLKGGKGILKKTEIETGPCRMLIVYD